jgi:hypothetical protein
MAKHIAYLPGRKPLLDDHRQRTMRHTERGKPNASLWTIRLRVSIGQACTTLFF